MARRQYEHQEYPKRVWHPETGRYKDAAGPGDVPEGWLTRHPMDPVHALPTGEISRQLVELGAMRRVRRRAIKCYAGT